jgi:hypothetical protein
MNTQSLLNWRIYNQPFSDNKSSGCIFLNLLHKKRLKILFSLMNTLSKEAAVSICSPGQCVWCFYANVKMLSDTGFL